MSEFLSNDILHESFIKSFAPFHWMQKVLGSCRIDARDCFVTSPTVWQKLYSGIIIILTSVFYVLFVLYYPSLMREHRSLLCLMFTILGIHHFVSVFNIFHVRFINNEDNIKFFMQLHEIDRCMGIEKKAYVHDVFFKTNIITVAAWTLIPASLFFTALVADWLEGLSYIWIFHAQITCAFEWMYFSNLIIYFYMRVRYINSIMINYLGIEDSSYSRMYKFIKIIHKTSLKELAAETSDFVSSDTDVYLKQVFDALLQFTSLFRFQMFFFCVKFVLLSTLSVEIGLLVLQTNFNLGVDRFIGPMVWMADFIILITICIRWDEFFKELCETKNIATKILATHTSGPLRKKANAMVKLIEEGPPHFSVYEMWNMDASTLLNIFDILTTLTITLMQFALL